VTRALVLVLLIVAFAGCASSSPAVQHARPTAAAASRCHPDPSDGALRPLFYIFCIQSP